MLKSNQTLLNEISTVGNLAVKDGILSVVHKKAHPLEIYMYGHQPLWFRCQLLPMIMPESVPSVDGTVHHTKPNHPGIL
jgi:hypothetical protein